jgi:hypothetical protein
MDIKTIAKNNQVSERFVYFLINKQRFTDMHFLAVDVARMQGTKPIDYIRPTHKALFKKIMPELNKKFPTPK